MTMRALRGTSMLTNQSIKSPTTVRKYWFQ
jgi:hypothetical protein